MYILLINMGPCTFKHKLSKVEQASWAELTHRGDLLDKKTKKATLIRVEKLSF